jgi:Flp pilus assembly protein protease CpaA
MLLTTRSWPIWAGFLLMIVAAVIDARTRKVPNVLTVPCLLGALVIALLWGQGGVWPRLGGGIESTLSTAGVTFLVLLIGWSFRFVGGGCLKMQTVFAAWLGCALPLERALRSSLVAVALVVFAFLAVEFAVRRTHRTSEEGRPKHANLRQRWIALLSITTILALDWMGLV